MDLREELVAAEQRALTATGRIHAAAEKLAEARVRAEAAGGDVKVAVDGNGRLLEIELARGSAGRHLHTLGTHVVEAVARARQQAIADGRAVLTDFMSDKRDPGPPPERDSRAPAPRDDEFEHDVYFQGVYTDGFR